MVRPERRKRPFRSAGRTIRAGVVVRWLGASHLALLVDLELVARLDVLELVQADAALVAVRHLGDVVLEAAQRGDDVLGHDHTVADDPHRRVAPDAAVGDDRAEHEAGARHLEDLPDLRAAGDDLFDLRREHALDSALDVLRGLVDDGVLAQVHAAVVDRLAGVGVGTHVERDDDGTRRLRQADIALVHRSDSLVDDGDAHLGELELVHGVRDGLDRARDVALDDQVQRLQLTRLDGAGELLQRQRLAVGELQPALARLAVGGDVTGRALVLDHAELIARVGHLVPAQDLHGTGGTRLGDGSSGVVEHRADLAVGAARDEVVTDPQGAGLHQHGRDGTAALVEVGLDDGTSCALVGICPQLGDVGLQQHHLEQVVEVLARLGGHVHHGRLAAELLGDEVVLRELGADPDRVSALLVDLVDRHDDRHLGGLDVVDRLHGLRLDAVVRGDHEDGHVRHARTTGAHLRERLVAGGVDEGDRPPVLGDLVGTDVLGDAARLAGHDVGLADGVQQQRLAVVDVPHDGDDRRARLQLGRVVDLLAAELQLFGRDEVDLRAHLVGDDADEVLRHGLRHGDHLAHAEQHAHDVGGVHTDELGELPDRDAGQDIHRALDRGPYGAAVEGPVDVLPGITVGEFAKLIGVNATDIVRVLFGMGEMITVTQSMSEDLIGIVADEMGAQVNFITPEELEFGSEEIDDPAQLQSRAPVVTVMGHVDHGKTLLLDAIREADVVSSEAGGITQHIGAYQVTKDGRAITFIDTPGHEAFTQMRARGARVTDVAILVVAADDGVKPQTVEAINHIKAAEVPIIVAVNKIDKEGADPVRVRTQLTEYDLIAEEFGGQTTMVNVSAKTGENLDDLLEMVLLQADIAELRANPDKRARGAVIEAHLDRGRGAVATVLVQAGTLRVGDNP